MNEERYSPSMSHFQIDRYLISLFRPWNAVRNNGEIATLGKSVPGTLVEIIS